MNLEKFELSLIADKELRSQFRVDEKDKIMGFGVPAIEGASDSTIFAARLRECSRMAEVIEEEDQWMLLDCLKADSSKKVAFKKKGDEVWAICLGRVDWLFRGKVKPSTVIAWDVKRGKASTIKWKDRYGLINALRKFKPEDELDLGTIDLKVDSSGSLLNFEEIDRALEEKLPELWNKDEDEA